MVQAPDVADVGQNEHLVEFGKRGCINAAHGKTACTHRVSHEIGGKFVAYRQMQQTGLCLRNQHIVGDGAVRPRYGVAGNEVLAEKSPIEPAVDALENDAVEVGLGFDNARFGGYMLHMGDVWRVAQHAVQRCRRHYGQCFVIVAVAIVGYLYVRSKPDDLSPDFVFEPDDHSHGYQHHRQAYGYAHGGYAHGRARHASVVALVEMQFACYEQIGSHIVTMPFLMAYSTKSTLLVMPILRNMLVLCVSTVRKLMFVFWAMSLFDPP